MTPVFGFQIPFHKLHDGDVFLLRIDQALQIIYLLLSYRFFLFDPSLIPHKNGALRRERLIKEICMEMPYVSIPAASGA